MDVIEALAHRLPPRQGTELGAALLPPEGVRYKVQLLDGDCRCGHAVAQRQRGEVAGHQLRSAGGAALGPSASLTGAGDFLVEVNQQ
jgi:hypothetical protein